MIWLMNIGGFILLAIISYIISAAILEISKDDFKHINILAIIIFIILYGISDCSKSKDKFYKENTELRDDF